MATASDERPDRAVQESLDACTCRLRRNSVFVEAVQDNTRVALEFWAATHGVASLAAAEMWSTTEALVRMTGLGRTMLRGLGIPENTVTSALTYAADLVTLSPTGNLTPRQTDPTDGH